MLDHNTDDYAILIKAAGMPTVEQTVFTASEMLFCSPSKKRIQKCCLMMAQMTILALIYGYQAP